MREMELFFWCFLEDMGPRPGSDYSLDRIDDDDENCTWSTASEQAHNRGSNKLNKEGVEYPGKTQAQIAREMGVTQRTVSHVLNNERWT